MFGRPLITDEAVSAERLIIHNEIVGANSKVSKATWDELTTILYGGHPFGHPVLGTEANLNAMNTETLREAHKAGYDHSRAVLVFVGNVPERELYEEVESLLPALPSNGLSERRSPKDFSPRPWPKPSVILRETAFASSMVYVLFPFDAGSPTKNAWVGTVLTSLFLFGGGSSPLYRIVREERSLVYQTYLNHWYGPGGAFIGFVAEGKRKNIDAIIQAFRDVFNDKTVRSQERLDLIKTGIKGGVEMRSVDPEEWADEAIGGMINTGRMISDQEELAAFDSLI